MAQIIAIWGSPDSGKTTLSCALAIEFAKRKKETIVIFTDNVTPVIPALFPDKTNKVGASVKDIHSIGKILNTVNISENDILEEIIPIPNFKAIGVLGYAYGENEDSYSYPLPHDVISLLQKAGEMCDYVLVDCMSDFTRSPLSDIALQSASTIIKICGCKYSDLVFYASQNKRTVHFNKASEYINVIGKLSPYDPLSEVENFYKHIDFILPERNDFKKIETDGSVFRNPLPKKYDVVIKDIAEKILAEGTDG